MVVRGFQILIRGWKFFVCEILHFYPFDRQSYSNTFFVAFAFAVCHPVIPIHMIVLACSLNRQYN